MELYRKMDKIEINVYGLSYGTDNIYTIIFKEMDGNRLLPIPIGAFEAQSIALSLEGIKSSRPLTHDLIKNILESFRTDIKEIIIYKFEEGVFYSSLLLSNNMEIDSRTSDAVTMALKYNCKMYTYDEIFNRMSDILNETMREIDGPETIEKTIEYLSQQLEKSIEEENYEMASTLRDEINKIKENLSDNNEKDLKKVKKKSGRKKKTED